MSEFRRSWRRDAMWIGVQCAIATYLSVTNPSWFTGVFAACSYMMLVDHLLDWWIRR